MILYCIGHWFCRLLDRGRGVAKVHAPSSLQLSFFDRGNQQKEGSGVVVVVGGGAKGEEDAALAPEFTSVSTIHVDTEFVFFTFVYAISFGFLQAL